ncbi:F-box/LRR-repeat protein 25 [Arabidopsis thaliana]
MEEEHHATVAVGNPSHRFDRPLIRRSSDSISNLPDEILHHILSFIPETNLVIRTSVLSKRWRHVWSKTPHLSFEWLMVSPKLINKTLASYTASKITSFHLCTSYSYEAGHVHSSIEFAMSHNVDNLSLAFSSFPPCNKFPDFFYTSSSLKRVELRSASLTPSCIVSWTSLRSKGLILSGCPILESLSLNICESLKYLDLTKSLRLTRLEIERRSCFREPMQSMQIVAPHIHYLRLRDSEAHCTFLV